MGAVEQCDSKELVFLLKRGSHIILHSQQLSPTTKRAHSFIIDISDALAYSLAHATARSTFIVHVGFEVTVDSVFVLLREAVLILVVMVAEIVSLTAWKEIIAKRLIRRSCTSIRVPVKICH